MSNQLFSEINLAKMADVNATLIELMHQLKSEVSSLGVLTMLVDAKKEGDRVLVLRKELSGKPIYVGFKIK